MFNRVLVSIDLTDECARALPVGAAIARRARAEFVALLVTSEHGDAALDRYEARTFLDDHGGQEVDVWLDPGDDVAEAIATYARDESTLVCISSHGRGAIGELLVGSVATAVERQRVGPVMLVGPEVVDWQGPRSLLVCCDDSNAGDALIPVAREWCNAMDLRPEVVHVQTPGERPRTKAAARVADALETRLIVRSGAVPAWTISDLAAQRPGALLMMASATTGRIARLLRGSTTRDVVAKAPVPLVAVPGLELTETGS